MKNVFPSIRPIRLAILLLIPFVLTVASCDDDDAPSSQNTKVNDWIYANMEFWYYWSTQLPLSPDRSLIPDEFFESLLTADDRFSWIQDNYQELLNSLQGITKEAGFEFVLYLESGGSNNVIGQIVYVKPSSPASAAGLKRGDVFSQINNQTLTRDNYSELLSQMGENYTLRYKPLDLASENFGADKTIALQPVQYSENPNHMVKTFDIDGKKIGYYVYNFFANGVGEGKEYANEMEEIFANFKSQGITDLVLDLRFNSGGAESAAAGLSSYIGKGVDDTKIFARKQYNDDVREAILDNPELGEDFLVTKFVSQTSNVGNQLSNGRVYILTGSRTASASELVVNALRPYMDVFLIGNVTVGKNVGSISLFDDEDPANTWGMQPIVVKIFNSLDQSDYGNGFTPNILDEDNNLVLYPLGDEREALLSHAIGQITGAGSSGRKGTESDKRTAISHSLDFQRRSNQLVIDSKLTKKIRVPVSQ